MFQLDVMWCELCNAIDFALLRIAIIILYFLLIESKSNMQRIQSDHADDIKMNEMLFEMLKCLPLTHHITSY